MSNKEKTYTEHDLSEMIRIKYNTDAYAFLPQVRNGTGFTSITRTADAIVMGLWPSRGLYLEGFEIKTYRNDWLNELKNPAKAEEISQFCDFWWIVAPKGIVKSEELPELWGLMEASGKALRIVKKAPKKGAINIDKLFLAAILRKAKETITPQAKIIEAYKKGKREGKDERDRRNEYELERYKELQGTVSNFRKNSGVDINSWYGENIGDAVRQVLNGAHRRISEQLSNLLKRSRNITKSIEEELNTQEAKDAK